MKKRLFYILNSGICIILTPSLYTICKPIFLRLFKMSDRSEYRRNCCASASDAYKAIDIGPKEDVK